MINQILLSNFANNSFKGGCRQETLHVKQDPVTLNEQETVLEMSKYIKLLSPRNELQEINDKKYSVEFGITPDTNRVFTQFFPDPKSNLAAYKFIYDTDSIYDRKRQIEEVVITKSGKEKDIKLTIKPDDSKEKQAATDLRKQLLNNTKE